MTRSAQVSRRTFLVGAGGAVAGWATWPRLSARGGEGPQRSERAYQVGIYTRPWDRYDYRVALHAIAEAGFQHVGLMTTTMPWGRLVLSATTTSEQAAAIGEEVRKRGLGILSVYPGGIPVQKSIQAGVEAMRRIIDNCLVAGAKSILMGGTGNAKLYDAYYKAIAETCDYAAEKNIPITVKPHGGLNATGPQCRKCIEMVGHENFSLWYDPGNIMYYSNGRRDPVEDAKTVAGLVRVGMCVKDFDMVEKNGELRRDVWITPGQGRVDFPKVLKVLRDGGFRSGALVIECVYRGDGSLETILAEAKKARAYVEELVAAYRDAL
ncbi:MAG TPA: sugar phosphate isomerase/epimerase [Planctomycetaceae bacterium]|nr:sugar phosphate isomerase/epimerase [Planctomycetaceae bacterium]